MLQSIKGIYRNGKVELLESPKEVRRAQVIVTFLDVEITTHGEGVRTGTSLVDSGEILTDDFGLIKSQFAELTPSPRRARLSPAKFDGQILVPFAVEAALSGVGKAL